MSTPFAANGVWGLRYVLHGHATKGHPVQMTLEVSGDAGIITEVKWLP